MATPPVSPKSSPFSPVKLSDSPCQVQKGNLTGTPRKVKDTVAEIHNSIQKWNNLHAEGLIFLRRISENLINSNDAETEIYSLDVPSENLTKNFSHLVEIKSKLVEIVHNLGTIHGQLRSLEKLEKFNQNFDPIFLTWTVSHYVEFSKQIYSSYKSQLSVNIYIIENLILSTAKSAGSLLALWIHQPYIEDSLNFKIESALKETGFS